MNRLKPTKSLLKIISKIRDSKIISTSALLERLPLCFQNLHPIVEWPIALTHDSPVNFQDCPLHSIRKRKELDTNIPEADIPKTLIKKLYSKYYLDFVLYGFSADSVQAIVDVGIEGTFNYSFKSKLVDEFAQYRKVMYKKEITPAQFWKTFTSIRTEMSKGVFKLNKVCIINVRLWR